MKKQKNKKKWWLLLGNIYGIVRELSALPCDENVYEEDANATDKNSYLYRCICSPDTCKFS